MSDTYATSHLTVTSTEAGEAANRAAANKRAKYSTIAKRMRSGGDSLVQEGLEFTMELRRRLTNTSYTTVNKLGTSYLFQRISVAVQRGNAMLFIDPSMLT